MQTTTGTVRKATGYIKHVQDGRRIAFVASHEKPDRDSEVIALSGLDISNYMKNPIFLIQHDWSSRAVARVEHLRKATLDGHLALVGEAVFPDRPASDEVLADIRAGLLSGISVGLLILEQGGPIMPGQKGLTILRSELVEISAVSIPACSSCLITQKEYNMKASCNCTELDLTSEQAAQIPALVDAAVTQALRGHSIAKRNEIDTDDPEVRRILKDLPNIVRNAFYAAVAEEARLAMRRLQGKVD